MHFKSIDYFSVALKSVISSNLQYKVKIINFSNGLKPTLLAKITLDHLKPTKINYN